MSTYYTGRRAQRYNERWRMYSEKTLVETLAMIDVTALRSVSERLGRSPRVLDVACGTGILLVQKHESESGMGVQGALPPAGARGVPASFPFPKKVC